MIMPDYQHALIIIIVMGIMTLATRVLPVIIVGRRESVPAYVVYLGRVVPYTAMGLLIVYCLRGADITSGSHGLPELIAMAAVTATYLWKRNSILSVVIGTAVYMFLVQQVFV